MQMGALPVPPNLKDERFDMLIQRSEHSHCSHDKKCRRKLVNMIIEILKFPYAKMNTKTCIFSQFHKSINYHLGASASDQQMCTEGGQWRQRCMRGCKCKSSLKLGCVTEAIFSAGSNCWTFDQLTTLLCQHSHTTGPNDNEHEWSCIPAFYLLYKVTWAV